MNKTELIAAVAAKAELSKAAASKAVEAALATIEEELKAGNSVQLIGFGTFLVKETPAHTGINPFNGEKIEVAAKKTTKFKAGAKLASL